MTKLSLETYLRDPEVRIALHAAARRERSRAIGRLLKRMFSLDFLPTVKGHGGRHHPDPRGA